MILIGADRRNCFDFFDQSLKNLDSLQLIQNPDDLLEEAIALAPQLIILNFETEANSSNQLCIALRENLITQEIPLIIILSTNNPETKDQSFISGANDVLVRPISSIELIKRVQQQLHYNEVQNLWHQQTNELKLTISRQRILRVVIDRIRRTLDLSDIFQSTAKEIHSALSCDRVVIYRFKEDWSGYFVAEAMSPQWRSLMRNVGDQNSNFFKNSALENDACIVKVFSSDPPDWIQDTYLKDNRGGIYKKGIAYRAVDDIYQAKFPDCYVELLESFQAKAYVILPIFLGGQLWGLLGIYQNSAPRHWTSEEIEMLLQICSQFGIAIQQTELLEELREAKKKAEAANQTKSLFLANMSHELRTPLSAILGFTELLSIDQNLTDDQRESLAIIAQSGQHLLGLINDVLSMSKIEAGKVTLSYETFDLFLCLNNIKDIVSFEAKQKGLQLLFEVSPDIPSFVYLDQGKLKQVLINLLNNAIKFTEVGRVTLRVSFDHHKNSITFAVTDTGVGISEQEIKQLFQAFQQTSSGIRSKKGTGLGLAISQQFIKLMDGEIKVKSQENAGSHFWFDLPLLVNPNISSLDLSRHKIIHLAPEQAIPKILIIEDQADQLDLLMQQLMGVGFILKTAMDGEEGLAIWREWQPDLILLDLRMPSIDGRMVIQKIREQMRVEAIAKMPKIIIVTADIFHEQKNDDTRLDCDEVIYKPVQTETLFKTIAQHLEVNYLLDE